MKTGQTLLLLLQHIQDEDLQPVTSGDLAPQVTPTIKASS